MPILPTFNNFFSKIQSRSQRRLNSDSVSSGEVLEFRRMLTNAAPEITGLSGANAAVSGLIEDDGSGGDLYVTITVGNTSEEFSVMEDETFNFDLASYIPPNTTATVTVQVTEYYDDENSGEQLVLSTSQTIQAAGVTILPIDFDWIDADGAIIFGEIDLTNVNLEASVSVMYREVGDTSWILGSDTINNGAFGFDVVEADGEKDFEFVVMHSGTDSVDVFGGSETFYDLDPEAEGNSEGNSGESNGETGAGGYGYSSDDNDNDDDENDEFFSNGWPSM